MQRPSGPSRRATPKFDPRDPKIQHPTNPDLLRQLTPQEHAALKGVPHALIDGLAQTTAHELLGQGIVYAPFEAVGHRIGESLVKLAGERGIPLEPEKSAEEPMSRRRMAGRGMGW